MRSTAFALLFIANLLQAIAGALLLHLPGHLAALGASETVVGTIMAAGAGIAILASPLIGQLLDSSPRGLLSLVALAAAAALAIALGSTPSLGPAFLTLFLLLELLIAFLYAALFLRAIALLDPQRRARGLALFSISTMGAVGLAAALGELVLAQSDFETLFQLMAALFGVAALPMLALQVWSDPQPTREHLAPAGPTDSAAAARGSFFSAISDPPLWPVWSLCIGFFAAMVSVFVFLKLTTAATGVGSLGLYFTVYAGLAVTLRVLAGGLPDRFDLLPFAVTVVLLYALGFILLATAESRPAFIAAAALGGIGHGFGYPVLMALATERSRAANRGSTLAMFNAIDQGMTLAAAPALGWILSSAAPAALYLTAATLAAMGALIAWPLRRAQR